MNDNWLVHNYDKRLKWLLNGIQSNKRCSKVNSQYLIDFHNYLFAEGLSIPRVVKYLRLLSKIDEQINKDFKLVGKQDIINYLTWLETSKYSELTKKDFKIGLKKFYKWMYNGKLPEFMSWVKCTVKNSRRMIPQEILSADEVLSMIKFCKNARDKAFISALYESGCRIGEIITLRLKNISFDKYGVIFIVKGKTGVRRVRIISSSNLIGRWLNEHPGKDDNESFLWCRMRFPKSILRYNSWRKILKIVSKKAGVNKKVNPHSFRHARATHMANKLTEAQMDEYFGWVQGSKMASVYVHLSGRDVDKAVLAYYGIEKVENEEDPMKPITCACGELNSPSNKYCNNCGKPLRIETVIGLKEKKAETQELMKKLLEDEEVLEKLKVLVKSK